MEYCFFLLSLNCFTITKTASKWLHCFFFFVKVAENHPLIGCQESLENLMSEYRDDPIYFKKMGKLCENYKSMRRVRPDGNCFFRGFGYSYFEKLLSDETEWKRFQTLVSASKDQLLSQGFPKFTLEDFYDSVICFRI